MLGEEYLSGYGKLLRQLPAWHSHAGNVSTVPVKRRAAVGARGSRCGYRPRHVTRGSGP